MRKIIIASMLTVLAAASFGSFFLQKNKNEINRRDNPSDRKSILPDDQKIVTVGADGVAVFSAVINARQTNLSVTITGVTAGIVKQMLIVNGILSNGWQPFAQTFSVSNTGWGPGTLRITLEFVSGKTGTTNIPFDAEPTPVVSITSPAAGVVMTNLTVLGSASIAAGFTITSIELSLNNGVSFSDVGNITWSTNVSLIDTQSYTLIARALGSSGRYGYSAPVAITANSAALPLPSIAFTLPTNTGSITTNITNLTIAGTASVSGGYSITNISLSIDNGASYQSIGSVSASWSTNVILAEGLNTLYARAYADDNKDTISTPITIAVSLPIPDIVIATPSNGINTNVTNIQVYGTASIATPYTITKVELSTNAGFSTLVTATGTSSWMSNIIIAEGVNTIYVRSYGSDGKISAVSNITVTCTLPIPALASIIPMNGTITNASNIMVSGMSGIAPPYTITKVELSTNASFIPVITANGTSTWMSNIVLADGVNTIYIRSYGSDGKISPPTNITIMKYTTNLIYLTGQDRNGHASLWIINSNIISSNVLSPTPGGVAYGMHPFNSTMFITGENGPHAGAHDSLYWTMPLSGGAAAPHILANGAYTRAFDVYVDAGPTVWVVGSCDGTDTACYWTNGVKVYMHPGFSWEAPGTFTVITNTFYSTLHSGANSYFYMNGMQSMLADSGYSSGILITNGVIYLTAQASAGYSNYLYISSNGGTTFSAITLTNGSIPAAKNGNMSYYAGMLYIGGCLPGNTAPCYWMINTTNGMVNQVLLPHVYSSNCIAYDISCKNGSVYAAGNDGATVCYWENAIQHVIETSTAGSIQGIRVLP
ncbi:MAG: hypothetical protein HZC28_07350 [Spirochaetes bacterium]|nr:hypothetical protein [Spirochaetota bacterium]